MRRTALIAGLVSLAVFATVLGVAASLTVNTATLGAGDSTVSSCDPNVNVSYTVAFTGSPPAYRVTQVTVSNIDTACAGKQIKVTLTKDGSSLVELTGTLDSPNFNNNSITFSVPADNQPKASEVNDVHVVITG
jgi:hypothetical protein